MRTITTGFLTLSLLLVTGCGGSSSPAPATVTPPPPVNTDPTFTKDVFQAESTFKDRCAVPRTGINPATGNAFPDIAGSMLYEKHWLRSWSNNTYLFFNEIDDTDPASIADRLDYFEILKTEAITASGKPKDEFHFTADTAERQQLISSGASAGYGAKFALISASVPRDIRIAFTEPSSPASTAPASLVRGTVVLEIDGVDAINGGTQADVDVLNAGLFPASEGEAHIFKVQDPGGTTRTFTMTSSVVTIAPVNAAKTIDIAGNKVGYLHFTTFGTSIAEADVVAAMQTFSNDGITDLVLDLRYNGGGFLDIAAELGFMIAGPTQTTGRTFDNIVFNSKHPNINPVTGQNLAPTPFYSTGQNFSVANGTPLPSVNLNRVFVLSTSRTCSASEAVINGLRGIDVEVLLIGSTTCGKPFGFYPTDNCGVTYFTIQFQGENDKGFGQYADGFTPINAADQNGELIAGCEIVDDFGHTLGDENEAQLAAALTYIQTGACPVVTTAATRPAPKVSQVSNPTSLLNDERIRTRILMEQTLLLDARDAKRGNK